MLEIACVAGMIMMSGPQHVLYYPEIAIAPDHISSLSVHNDRLRISTIDGYAYVLTHIGSPKEASDLLQFIVETKQSCGK